jgi:multiple sugar transport system substrate-binding protein
MKKVKVFSLVLFVALLGVALLSACATETPTPETITIIETVEVEVPGETVVETVVVETTVIETVEVEKEVSVAGDTLVFSSRLFSPPREQEFFINEIIKPWEDETGITVNFGILDDDKLFDRATIQQSTGHVTTDIVCAHNGKMPDWLDAGYVLDLTPYVDQWTDRNFSPAFEGDTNRDGKQYFLPVGADVYLTLANNKALDYLPEGVDMDAITWDQYADWAVAIAEGEGEGKVCITGIPSKSWIYMFGGTALSYGAGFLTTRIRLSSPWLRPRSVRRVSVVSRV